MQSGILVLLQYMARNQELIVMIGRICRPISEGRCYSKLKELAFYKAVKGLWRLKVGLQRLL